MATEKMMGTTGQITDINSFASAVKQMLGQAHPSADVEVHEVRKNNNLMLTGIAIREKGRNIAPTVYLGDFFEAYQNGMPLDEVCRAIEETSQKAMPDRDFDVNSIAEFSAVKEKICYRLVNAERNAARLKEMPHRLWQDLAVIYYVPVSMEAVGGVPSVTVGNHLMELWGVDEDTLYGHAHRNTPALFHPKIMSMAEVVKNMFQGMEGTEAGMPTGMLDARDPEDMPQLYVATNACQMNGAAVLLYDGVLEKFAGQMGGDFCILPSSIHETLFLPVPPGSDGHDLTKMVREVNAGCLAPDEILSDNAYLYHAGDGSVTLVR